MTPSRQAPEPPKTPREDPIRSPEQDFELARGMVALYGEASAPYFTLAPMPQGVDFFVIDSPRADHIGSLARDSGERGREILVFFRRGTGTTAFVFEARVEQLGNSAWAGRPPGE